MRPLALVLALSGCAFVQKVDTATLNCAEPTVVASLSTALTQAIGALTGSNTTAALEQLGEADGITVAFCAVQAAVTALENGAPAGPAPMVAQTGALRPLPNVAAIARGEAWLAVHSR
jgi:hypothetical protein